MKNTVQISQWEGDRYVPNAKRLGQLAQVLGTTTEWLISGNGKPPLSESALRETLSVREEAAAYVVPGWLEVRAESLDRELARSGAVDSQLNYVKSIMRSPATLKFVLYDDDGALRPLDDQRQQLELFIEGMRFWLERSATPGGAPIAPVVAAPESGAEPKSAEARGKKK